VGESQETEKLIKDTAREIFFQKGRLKATTQEIADEAGVNRTLIHYYFRSREQLLQIVFEEAVKETREKIGAIFKSDSPFKVKISQYLDVFIDRNIRYPYMQNFIITEINQNPEKEAEYLSKKRASLSKTIFPQLEEEISKGGITPIKPEHFMANLMSMCSYPLVAKPILQGMFNLNDEEYKTFLRERKNIIYTTLFNEEPPKE
jgi:TetR/AcrR family transcriptional regulator